MRDAKNHGRKALQILREHYLSKGKPRIISLYTELTSLKKSSDESVTDYILRAETAATSLKTSGEVISDSLLTAMVLKGLPAEFKPFSTVITQKDKSLTFSKFKVALRSFEETEKCSHGMESSSSENSVTKVQYRSDVADRSHKPNHPKPKDTQAGSRAFSGTCFKCGKRGHRAADCHSKKRWCEICKNHTHDTKWCRKKDCEVCGW